MSANELCKAWRDGFFTGMCAALGGVGLAAALIVWKASL